MPAEIKNTASHVPHNAQKSKPKRADRRRGYLVQLYLLALRSSI